MASILDIFDNLLNGRKEIPGFGAGEVTYNAQGLPQPGNNQAIPTTTAAPTTSAGGTQSPLEALTQRLQQGPQSTMGERLGITDEGLGISSILGSLAKAVDPSGWGGNLGGAYSQMMQGESAARNSRDIAYEQQMQNLTMMQLLQGLISGNNGGGLSQ